MSKFIEDESITDLQETLEFFNDAFKKLNSGMTATRE